MVIITFLFMVAIGGMIGCILVFAYMDAYFLDVFPSPEEKPGLWVAFCLYGMTIWIFPFLICFVFEGVLST